MEPMDFTGFSFLPTLITSLVTGAITWLGTFIFYRQKRDGMDIANEAQRSAEWKKLYEESKRDSEEKDKKIDELRRRINELSIRMNDMDRTIQLNSIYRCEVLTCNKRRPPMDNKPRDERGRYIKRSGSMPADMSHIDPAFYAPEEPEEQPEVKEQPLDPEPPVE